MSRSPLVGLSKALYSSLSDHLDCPVTDQPQGEGFPYVVLGEPRSVDSSTKDLLGMEITYTIHIFSDYQGDKEVLEIADEIVSALHDNPLLVEYFSVSTQIFNSLDIMTETDDKRRVRHGVMDLMFRLQEAM